MSAKNHEGHPPTPPLEGKTVALVCSSQKSQPLVAGLESMGASVILLEAIAIRELEDKTALDTALRSLDEYAWIIFTSSYSVQFFARRMIQLGITLPHSKIAAVGPATAESLQRNGFHVSLIPEEFVGEGIVTALYRHYGGPDNLAGVRFLLPRAREARDIIPRELSSAGARVDVVPCYETVAGRIDEETMVKLRNNPPDLFVFTSSSTVTNFIAILGEDHANRMLRHATTAALGPITARTLTSCGKRVDIIPSENTGPSLLTAIRDFYS